MQGVPPPRHSRAVLSRGMRGGLMANKHLAPARERGPPQTSRKGTEASTASRRTLMSKTEPRGFRTVTHYQSPLQEPSAAEAAWPLQGLLLTSDSTQELLGVCPPPASSSKHIPPKHLVSCHPQNQLQVLQQQAGLGQRLSTLSIRPSLPPVGKCQKSIISSCKIELSYSLLSLTSIYG